MAMNVVTGPLTVVVEQTDVADFHPTDVTIRVFNDTGLVSQEKQSAAPYVAFLVDYPGTYTVERYLPGQSTPETSATVDVSATLAATPPKKAKKKVSDDEGA